MGLRAFSIGKRAGFIFVFIGLLVFAMGLTALFQARQMNTAAEGIRAENLPALISLSEISSRLWRVRALTNGSMVLGRADKERTLGVVRQVREEVGTRMASYEKLIEHGEAKALYDTFLPAYKKYADCQSRILDAIDAGREAEAVELLRGEYAQYANDMMAKWGKLFEWYVEDASAAGEASAQTYHSAIWVIVSSLGVIIVLLGACAIALTRSIVSPLSDAVVVANRVASGDLTQDIQVKGNDEPAQLLSALKKMQLDLHGTIRQISRSSDQLASASAELHAVTEDANRGLNQQSAEIEQAATAVNEMTVAVEEVASNAVTTADASRDADQSTQEGRGKVNQALESIRLLVGDVAHTSQEVKQLAEHAVEISQVLVVIRSIAEQTNLLALNAAIEAARAGEAGRGFAVVADEVRALAHRTQQSTAEIEKMIEGVQSGTGRAVQAMGESQERANQTLDMARAANDALEVIGEAITSINQKNLVIASASEEQAQVAREVDRNLVNIRDLSMQTTAGANRAYAASQALSGLATELNTMITKFKV